MNEWIKLKIELVKLGWEIDEKMVQTKEGSVAYSIWVSRSEWHGKDTYSITGNSVTFFGNIQNFENEKEVEAVVKKLYDTAVKAWNSFPTAVPRLNSSGELEAAPTSVQFAQAKNYSKS